jgi:hypothetical protein
MEMYQWRSLASFHVADAEPVRFDIVLFEGGTRGVATAVLSFCIEVIFLSSSLGAQLLPLLEFVHARQNLFAEKFHGVEEHIVRQRDTLEDEVNDANVRLVFELPDLLEH